MTSDPAAHVKETPKQAAMGLLISFVMVLVFRGFCFESFHIPTGSMAPTLMGQHHRFQSEQTGFDWAVNSWVEYWINLQRSGRATPANPVGALSVADPMAGSRITQSNPSIRGGDRIGILKYNRLYRPERWDVIVVKWPAMPHESYIKRLVGLPGETLWLCDGDVFVKKGTEARRHEGTEGEHSAAETDTSWEIQRKPERVQRAVWWPEFSSEHTPLDRMRDGRAWSSAWQGEGIDTLRRAYEFPAGGGEVRWDEARWPVSDWAPYNDQPMFAQQVLRFPVSDVRVRAEVEALAADTGIEATIDARGCEFRAAIRGGEATLEMRAPALPGEAGADEGSADAQGRGVVWKKAAKIDPLPVGRATSVELWHVDQRVQLWVRGRLVLEGVYEWGPRERLARALRPGLNLDALLAEPGAGGGNPLADPRLYRGAGAAWRVSGAARLHRVGLDRDLHYQASSYRFSRKVSNGPALGTHPANLARLTGEEYFLCGDNSGNSADSRLVDDIDPWVAHRFDASLGVVHRRMISGRAAMVFWPAAHPVRLGATRYNFVPDVGRVRWIR